MTTYSSVSMDFGGFKKNSPMIFQNDERSPMDFNGWNTCSSPDDAPAVKYKCNSTLDRVLFFYRGKTMQDIFVIILFFLVGGLILWATFTGKSVAPRVTGLIGVWFLMIPICLINQWYKAFAIVLCLPLGILWTVMAVVGVTQPFRYCRKGEGVYVRPVPKYISRRRPRYFSLECNYRFDGKGYQRHSKDFYMLNRLNKKYIEGDTIPIWINRKDPTKFVVRRFFGVLAYSLLLFIGVEFIILAVCIMLGILPF